MLRSYKWVGGWMVGGKFLGDPILRAPAVLINTSQRLAWTLWNPGTYYQIRPAICLLSGPVFSVWHSSWVSWMTREQGTGSRYHMPYVSWSSNSTDLHFVFLQTNTITQDIRRYLPWAQYNICTCQILAIYHVFTFSEKIRWKEVYTFCQFLQESSILRIWP